MTVKNCGSCRWWELCDKTRLLGWCNFPLPISIDADTETCVEKHDGTDCPCHSPQVPESINTMLDCHKTGSSISASDYRDFFEWAIQNLPQLKGDK